ncbi:hypothetical protein MBLNU457_7090t1 [Dothideomycetes sp. NU457]
MNYIPDLADLNIHKSQDIAVQESQTNPRNDKLTKEFLLPPRQPRDITSDFAKASLALKPGQLIKDEDFTLFESVGALEIMDPKMDSGFAVPDQDAAMEQFDPLMYTLPEEIIGIMDQIFEFEMSWHDGYPLSQNLFTSLHINNLLSPYSKQFSDLAFQTTHSKEDPKNHPLVTVVLRAYCLVVLKSCDSVMREVMSEHYYEEEDFSTSNFNRDLSLFGVDNKILIELLEGATRVVKALAHDYKGVGFADEISQALIARLELRQLLVEAFDPKTVAVDKAQIYKKSKDILQKVDGSHGLGTAIPDAFSERVQRYLASNTPPRPMMKTSWAETVKKLGQLCDDGIEAANIVECFPSPAPHALMAFCWSFSSRTPQPSTYSRAVMQGMLFRNNEIMNRVPHIDLLVSDMRELVLAGDTLLDPANWETEMPSDPRYQLARKVDEFLSKASDEYFNLYRMPLQNRCRIRRTLSQSIAILDSLQAVAEDTDTDIQNITRNAPPNKLARHEPANYYPIASWVFFHKLRVMEHVLLLGFELSVYSPDENSSIYALLAHLLTTRSQHTTHLLSILTSRHQRLSRNPTDPVLNTLTTSISHLTTQTRHATATAHLASALSTLYTLLTITSPIPTPERPYSTDALRHELRLKSFLPAGSPGLPSHDELRSLTHPAPETRIKDLVADANENLRLAKRELAALKSVSADEARVRGVEKAWREGVRGLLVSCIGAGVAVAGIEGALKLVGVDNVGNLDGKRKGEVARRVKVVLPEVGEKERWSDWWVVPKVVDL